MAKRRERVSGPPVVAEPRWLGTVRAINSPRAQRWSNALRALEAINAQAPVADLLAQRDPELDYLIAPALRQAHAWIVQLQQGYHRHDE